MPDQPAALHRWYAVAESEDPALLDELLADEVVFRCARCAGCKAGRADGTPAAAGQA